MNSLDKINTFFLLTIAEFQERAQKQAQYLDLEKELQSKKLYLEAFQIVNRFFLRLKNCHTLLVPMPVVSVDANNLPEMSAVHRLVYDLLDNFFEISFEIQFSSERGKPVYYEMMAKIKIPTEKK